MDDPRVAAFLSAYASAFGALDPEAIADCYALPCAFINPISRTMVETRDALLKKLTRITRAHRKTGWARAEAELVAASPHGGHFLDLRVRWRVSDAAGASLWDFEHGYLLGLSEAEAVKIVAAIGY